MAGDTILLSGKLLKKSHNKYKREMQERFVVIRGSKLLYYKKEGDALEAGSIRLDTATFCRPYDRTSQCCIFELFDDGRLYGFQAASNAEMQRWLTVIDTLRVAVQSHAKEKEAERLKSLIPIRIRKFDEDGIDAFCDFIRGEMNDIFPDFDSPDYVPSEEEGEDEEDVEEEEEDDEEEEEEEEDDDEDDDSGEKLKSSAKGKKKSKAKKTAKEKKVVKANLEKRINRAKGCVLYFEGKFLALVHMHKHCNRF